ncbi:hypothetical protein BJ742DRAFT_57623 [Cladochytrium replicatum]|nr:hypothetical protein BJ742DRAFT_57623 [Cladochytrium replicatum]
MATRSFRFCSDANHDLIKMQCTNDSEVSVDSIVTNALNFLLLQFSQCCNSKAKHLWKNTLHERHSFGRFAYHVLDHIIKCPLTHTVNFENILDASLEKFISDLLTIYLSMSNEQNLSMIDRRWLDVAKFKISAMLAGFLHALKHASSEKNLRNLHQKFAQQSNSLMRQMTMKKRRFNQSTQIAENTKDSWYQFPVEDFDNTENNDQKNIQKINLTGNDDFAANFDKVEHQLTVEINQTIEYSRVKNVDNQFNHMQASEDNLSVGDLQNTVTETSKETKFNSFLFRNETSFESILNRRKLFQVHNSKEVTGAEDLDNTFKFDHMQRLDISFDSLKPASNVRKESKIGMYNENVYDDEKAREIMSRILADTDQESANRIILESYDLSEKALHPLLGEIFKDKPDLLLKYCLGYRNGFGKSETRYGFVELRELLVLSCIYFKAEERMRRCLAINEGILLLQDQIYIKESI